MKIPLSRPDINENDIQAVVDVLRTPQLSLGPKLPEFEAAFSAFTGARYAVAVSSGTAALHLAVKALDIGCGDEVITTPFSFVASTNCILYERARPVLVDIDPFTFNIDPEKVREKITSKTKALLPVHVFGRPADMDSLMSVAAEHGLKMIEDACEALGAFWRERHVGAIGDLGTFAFYPNKQMTTGEGGMIVTDNSYLAQICKSFRNQGRDSESNWLQHERLGFNYRIDEMSCALGLSQLARIDELLRRRARVANLYRLYLQEIEEVELPPYEVENARISWFVYVIRLKHDFAEERDNLLGFLRSRGIACSDYFRPIHQQPYFRSLGYRRGDFPVAERIGDSTVALPFFTGLAEDEIQYVCDVVKQALFKYGLTKTAAYSVHRPVL